jgi:hypothetical protein
VTGFGFIIACGFGAGVLLSITTLVTSFSTDFTTFSGSLGNDTSSISIGGVCLGGATLGTDGFIATNATAVST